MRRPVASLLLLTLLIAPAAGCQGAPAPVRATAPRASKRPPALAPDLSTLTPTNSPSPGGSPAPGGARAPSEADATSPQAALRGRVVLPASLITNNGAGLVSNHGAGVVSNNGAALLGKAKYGLGQAGTVVQAPLAGAPLALVDATGEPVRDAAGQPYLATTDADGRYAFARVPTDRAFVVVCQAAGQATQAAALVPRAVATADLDLSTTVMSAYILDRFARTQPDPQASLERLPAELAARAREATRRAIVTVPERLDLATSVSFLAALRGREASLDVLYEEVRRAMVVAGQSDLGAGELATRARFARLTGSAIGPGGTRYVMDGGAGRLWKVEAGRLVAVAGLGGGIEEIPDPPVGAKALAVNLGEIVALALDSAGRPLLLGAHRLDRVKADGTLERLWAAPPPAPDTERPTAIGVVPMPEGGALVVTGAGLIGVGGAKAPPIPVGVELQAVVRRPDGATFFLTRGSAASGAPARGWWRGTDTAAPTLLSVPEAQTETSLAGGLHAVARRWLGLCEDGFLAVADDDGTLWFISPDDRAVQAHAAAATARWPEMLRPAPTKSDFGGATMKSYPRLEVGGDAVTGRWVQGSGCLGLIGADSGITMVAGDGTLSPSGSTVDTPTALARPLAAALDAAGTLIVVEESSRQVLRVVDRVASLLAGVPWNQGYALGGVPGQPGELELQPGGTGLKLRFGTAYAAPAAAAYFLKPQRLRLAPDGAAWVLDDGRAVRRVADGAVTTLAARTEALDKAWLDIWPTSATAGVALVRRDEAMWLVSWPQPPGTPPMAVFPAPPPPRGDEADLDPDDEAAWGWRPNGHPADGLAPLPAGGWLIRAYGETWRYRPGSGAVRLLPDGLSIPWHPEETQGGRLAATAGGLVAFAGKRHIYRVEPETGRHLAVAGSGTPNLAGDLPDDGLIHVKGVAVAPSGDLLIVDAGARQVKRLPAAAWTP